jgi:uncharacterized protein
MTIRWNMIMNECTDPELLTIIVDADACPVKDEVYRVAKRYKLRVVLVSNSRMRIPSGTGLELVVVDNQFDAADDWIADRAKPDDIVISNDIPLASRCIKKGAHVVSPSGRLFTEQSIGETLATRDLMAQLRGAGMITGGPPPFSDKDRSRFLRRLDELIQMVRNKK